jgi:WD40 repeat protein
VAFSPDGRLLASGCRNGTLKVRNLETRKERFSVQCETSVGSLSFSPDSRILAGSIGMDRVRLWDTITGQEHASKPKD